jgi:hypothetical protein
MPDSPAGSQLSGEDVTYHGWQQAGGPVITAGEWRMPRSQALRWFARHGVSLGADRHAQG